MIKLIALAVVGVLITAPAWAACGTASYYGGRDHLCGRKTANGERLNCRTEATAAHRHLPFGSRVNVTHKGRSVVVRINDRGPFVRGRILDLNPVAAKILGIFGTGRVCF